MPARKRRRFKHPLALHRSVKNTTDGTGTVRVTVMMVGEDRRNHVKGNIMRSLTVGEAKVSEVFRAVYHTIYPHG